MAEGRRDRGPVPVAQVDGAGRPARTTDGPLRTGARRLDDLLREIDTAVAATETTLSALGGTAAGLEEASDLLPRAGRQGSVPAPASRPNELGGSL